MAVFDTKTQLCQTDKLCTRTERYMYIPNSQIHLAFLQKELALEISEVEAKMPHIFSYVMDRVTKQTFFEIYGGKIR